MIDRGVIRGMDLDRVVAAAAQLVDVVVGHVRHQRLQLRILVEERLAVEAAVGGGVLLELAVDGFVQALDDHVVVIAGEQRIPVGAPQQLDHAPAGTGEQAFELLDDRAVAPHRAVEALQVAVDDEDQVVEAFTRGERQAGKRFRLVHLAVTHERPDLAAVGVEHAAVAQVAHELGLVDCVERAQAHRAGRKLPEVRHQIRVAVRRQSLAAGLAPVVVQLVHRHAAFEIGARIHARRRMRLEVHQVATLPGAEEVVEAHLEQVGRRCVARDVSAEIGVGLVGAHDHRQRVPPHQ